MGRSIRGSGALTEFSLEAATDTPDKFDKLKIAGATADLNMPETVLEPKFDDKSGKRRVTGPIFNNREGPGQRSNIARPQSLYHLRRFRPILF